MTTPKNTDIIQAPQQRPQDGATQLVEKLLPEMSRALPQHVGKDRMARMLLTTFRKTPKLLSCDRASLMGAMLEVARLGLEPGQEVHLIPYGREAQVIIDYQGLLRLMYQSGFVSSIQTGIHREGDEWEVEFGLEPKLRHVPCDNPGKMLHAYAVARLKDGGYAFRVLTKAEVDKVKKNSGPWRDHYDAMAEKTALRRLAKYIPKSPEMMAAMRLDERSVTLDEWGETTVIDTTPEPQHEAIPAGPEASAIRGRLMGYLPTDPGLLKRLIDERIGEFESLDDIKNCDDLDRLIAADVWVGRVVSGGGR